MKILGLIPARGGSKGVPRKNIKLLGGIPLIAHSIKSGLACPYLTQVVVSTEDPEIAEIARKFGASVPFMRPASLASDGSPSIDTVVHALKSLSHEDFDAVCLLQPTFPFRNQVDLDRAIEEFVKEKPDSLISMKSVPHEYHPRWVFMISKDDTVKLFSGESSPVARRQDLEKVMVRDGAIYITRSSLILEKETLYGEKMVGYHMKRSKDINIDTLEDWEEAEIYANGGE